MSPDEVDDILHQASANIVALEEKNRLLTEALLRLTPNNPFQGDELSGGPACVGCGTDRGNAQHNDTEWQSRNPCAWVQARKALGLPYV